MYFTYIPYSPKTNKFYIGSTNNLERRLLEHNSNKTKSLKNKGPFKLVYKEKYSDSVSEEKRIPDKILQRRKRIYKIV